MTTTETLRRAAALMRERAQAATFGPWEAVEGEDEATPLAPTFPAEGDRLLLVAEPTWMPDAEHIASWPPAVALAVADWLDADAKFAEESPFYEDLDSEEERAEFLSNPLAVARAYLNEEPSP